MSWNPSLLTFTPASAFGPPAIGWVSDVRLELLWATSDATIQAVTCNRDGTGVWTVDPTSQRTMATAAWDVADTSITSARMEVETNADGTFTVDLILTGGGG